MKTFFIILLLLPLSIFASNKGTNDYEALAKEQLNKQQQIISSCAGEIKSIVNQADRRTAEIESYISWFSPEMKKREINEKNSGVDKVQAKIKNDFSKMDARTKEIKTLVFVSFSMPETSLRQWLSDAHKIGASVVIRGLKNNSFKETAEKIIKLLDKTNQGGLEINPLVFREYHIAKVPAVVVVDESLHNFDIVYGNVSLEYALKIIADKAGK